MSEYVILKNTTKESRQKAKELKLKNQYLNCVILDNDKEYNTNDLSIQDVEELKQLGYEFMFSCVTLRNLSNPS